MVDNMEKEETLTVGELIESLQLYDKNLPVMVYAVGITAACSWSAPLEFGKEDTVDVFNGVCRISFSIM